MLTPTLSLLADFRFFFDTFEAAAMLPPRLSFLLRHTPLPPPLPRSAAMLRCHAMLPLAALSRQRRFSLFAIFRR